jgi:putative endonuclease
LKRDRRREIGQVGEQAAADFLSKQGFQVITRNWSTRLGELDIIARDGEALVVVEVRTTTSQRFGFGYESIDMRKQQKVRRLALQYIHQQRITHIPLRFDVVSVLLDQERIPKQIDHLKGAF